VIMAVSWSAMAGLLVTVLAGCGDDSVTNSFETESGVELTIIAPEFDFGYVPQNSTISHTFWLYSTGEDTLRIDRVVPG
jgi:hypothetical protein